MKVLIVEDETLVACSLEMLLEDLGCQPVGIAADAAQALDLAGARPELAFVDVNLRDGPTGPTIGAHLAREGVKVVFLTANPSQLGAGVPGAIGVLTKPYIDSAIEHCVAFLRGARPSLPAELKLFAGAAG